MKSLTSTKYFSCLFILLSAMSLMSCSPEEDVYAGGGIGGTGVISTGTVTDIGSVWVNGVEFNTQAADVFVNEIPKGRGDAAVVAFIHPGQVVRVDGSLNDDDTGLADTVYYCSILSGPVREMETVGKYDLMLTILGQKVIANEETILRGSSLESLGPGNLLDISGFIDDTGIIQASFMAKNADAAKADDRFFIAGVVRNLNENDKTFLINALAVHYENANLKGFLVNGLENGMWVHAQGRYEDAGETFAAEILIPFDRLENDRGNQVEIEGVIRSDLLENRFSLETRLVEATAATLFENGDREELLSGSRIEAEGRFSGGVLIAERIQFIAGEKLQGEILEMDFVNRTLKVQGFEDVAVEINSLTRFNGQAKNFEQLGVGDHLMIRGRLVEEDTLLATRIIKKP